MIGIDNVNEYYTHHYLAAILQGDIKPALERWRAEAQGDRTPWDALSRLQQPFFRFRDRLVKVRDPEERRAAHAEQHTELLAALGYAVRPADVPLPTGPVRLLAAYHRADGSPWLWLLPAPSAVETVEDDVLSRPVLGRGGPPVEALITEAFAEDEPPRFVLVLGDAEWVLADRGKWPEQRVLRFDWAELLGRRDVDALQAATALLHRESLAPASGTALVDTLDDSSHKHAYEVSDDLKVALRECVERIGNEAIRYRRDVSKKKVFDDEITGPELATECIRYMYRILFLLYVEARPELGYAPVGSDAWRLGYGFEWLRDLESRELETDEAREGFTVHAWLERLFALVWEGTTHVDAPSLFADAVSVHHGFRLVPLRSHLFDPERTKFLNKVKLRNEVLLEVVRGMSLTRPKKKQRRGRISYATLGINQLGAAYEALLSFRGFFAEERLYEVQPKPKKDKGEDAEERKGPDPVKDPVYLVAESELRDYAKDERVYDEAQRVKAYEPGTFLYRIAGRDREKTASYYTPEVLTRCLVKYALKELLDSEEGRARFAEARDLLRITVCEPAMGSAAFLNEAVNQLAERYLQRRQQELGERIPHERYRQELQRVRMYLADNNVFGVDLNPLARELAEVSLWLNAIFTEPSGDGAAPRVFVPWFGAQLAVGNSLVGCWRSVFPEVDGSAWLDAVPQRVALGTERPAGSVYHFLLPDRGMSTYGAGNEGAPIREMCAASLAAIEAWREGVCAPLTDDERAALARLSDAVDRLWASHVTLLGEIRRRTTDPLSVYGHTHPLHGQAPTTTEDKDRIWSKEMASEQVRASSPYRRLKLAMDYWCALWFWPIDAAEELPERDEWLSDLAMILDDRVLVPLQGEAQRDLFAPTMAADRARALVDEVGFADVERLVALWPRLRRVDALAQRYRFLHWELEVADVFAARGGFDLVLGNPPWVRVEWKEAAVMGDADPSFVLRKLSASEAGKRRAETMGRPGFADGYLRAHEEAAGTQSFLSAKQCYPELQGVKVNLYKGFLPRAWALGARGGVAGLLHPEKVYDEPTGGRLRRTLYSRLRRHYQFANELRSNLFAEVDNHTRYSVNVYGPAREDPEFVTLANVFLPKVIDECHDHPGGGPVPGIKDADNEWCLTGHRERLIRVGAEELALFAALFDEPGTPAAEARLPAVHSTELLPALAAFARAPRRLGDLGEDEYRSTDMWNESRAQKDGTIREETRFVESPDQLVLSGPHFYVGTPLYKTPKAVCNSNKAYSVVDLEHVPDDYLPRTNFVPECSPAEYRARSPKVPWAEDVATSELYRLVVSRGLSPGGERTVQPAIAMPGAAHIDGVYSYAFVDSMALLAAVGTWGSLPVDFLVKSTGAGDFRPNLARRMPIVPLTDDIAVRVLVMNCTTSHYADLWAACWRESFRDVQWFAGSNRRLAPDKFARLGPMWTRDTPLRDDYSRRWAMVELDVLVAKALGWTLDQLITAYRSLFFVLQNYERDTWYDANGRIVFTNNGTGLPGVGLPRSKSANHPTGPYWNDVQDLSEERGCTGGAPITRTILDDTLPGGPVERFITYQPPWVRCNRERDYVVSWNSIPAPQMEPQHG